MSKQVNFSSKELITMTGNEYQQLAMVTSNKSLSPDYHLLNGVMGMCGEAGECVDLVKKNIDKLKARYPEGFEVDKSLHHKVGDV